jgi:hypothetical protein
VSRFAVLLLASAAAFAQFKLQPAGEPPPEVAPDILVTLSKLGTRIEADNGSTVAEIWMRASAPRIPPPPKSNIAPARIPSGALVGVLRLTGKGSDMRGQSIPPGSYTLRYLGASAEADSLHRDFILLIPASIDKSTRTITHFEMLLDESRKASGTPNPPMFGFWKAGRDFKPGIEKSGPVDWLLQTKLGDLPICILMGQTE